MQPADKNETTAKNYINNQADGNYTDLQENSRASRNYTELQTRNADYSDIETSGHAYANTQLKA